MASYALFLRGVNVGGNKKVPMVELKSLLESLGCVEPRTLLNSGNAVFRGKGARADALEKRVGAAILLQMGVETECFVRTDAEWPGIMRANPFRNEAQSDPALLHLYVLRTAPGARALNVLRNAIRGPERVELTGRELWAYYPGGAGNSKLTLPLIEKTLGTLGTGRNWNTVEKVAELLKA